MMMDDKDLTILGVEAFSALKGLTGSNIGAGHHLVSIIESLGYQITKKPESWNGEGLPPVGTECEYFYSGNWRFCIYRGKTEAGMHILETSLGECSCLGSLIKFRPIRKQEEEKLWYETFNALVKDDDWQYMSANDKTKNIVEDTVKRLIEKGYIQRPNNQ